MCEKTAVGGWHIRGKMAYVAKCTIAIYMNMWNVQGTFITHDFSVQVWNLFITFEFKSSST